MKVELMRKAARKSRERLGRLRMRRRRKFTHLDFRVAPPQRYTWGRSPITVSRAELEFCFFFAAALVSTREVGGGRGRRGRGGERGESEVPLSHCTKASLKKKKKKKKDKRQEIINYMSLDCHKNPVCKFQTSDQMIGSVSKLWVRWRFWSSWEEPILGLVLCCSPAGKLLP